jgi:hypothetical protein
MRRSLVSSALAGGLAVALLALPSPRSAPPPPRAATPPGAPAVTSFGRLPLAFERNLGQHDERARYVARGSGGTAYLTASGARVAIAGDATA